MIKKIYLNIIFLFIVIFGVCLYSEKIVNKYSYTNGKSINKVVLPDIIQNNIKNIKNLDVISDLFIMLVVSIFFIIFILNGNYKYILFYLFIFVIMRFVTFIYFISTTLPDSSKKCKYGEDFFKTAMNMGTCNNLGISGHFINIVFQLGLIYRYYGSSYWFWYLFVYIISFILICASRNHYTIDCISSTFVGLFFIYEIDNFQKGLNYIIGRNYFNI